MAEIARAAREYGTHPGSIEEGFMQSQAFRNARARARQRINNTPMVKEPLNA